MVHSIRRLYFYLQQIPSWYSSLKSPSSTSANIALEIINHINGRYPVDSFKVHVSLRRPVVSGLPGALYSILFIGFAIAQSPLSNHQQSERPPYWKSIRSVPLRYLCSSDVKLTVRSRCSSSFCEQINRE